MGVSSNFRLLPVPEWQLDSDQGGGENAREELLETVSRIRSHEN